MLYSSCCLTIIIYIWCYWPKLWMPTNPTSVWSGPVACHFSAATVGSFSLLHTSRIHPGNLTAKWWLEDLLNLLKWSFFRGMDIYMNTIAISNSHQQKPQGQKELTVKKGVNNVKKNPRILGETENSTHFRTVLARFWSVFCCFAGDLELTNEAGGKSVALWARVEGSDFLSQEVARPETPKEARCHKKPNSYK